MMRLVPTGAAGRAGLGSAKIFRPWKFIPRVINHVVTRNSGSNVGLHLRDFYLHHDRGEDQEGLQQIGGDHDAVGN
jgi:hypothetical protein